MRLLRTPLVIEAGSRSHTRSAGLLGWARPEGEVEVQTRLDLWYFKAGTFEWIMMRSPRALVAMRLGRRLGLREISSVALPVR